MPLIRLISQSFRFCNFRLPNLNTKTRMWFGWEERHEQQTRYHFPFSLNPFRADSEANGTELSLHQPRFVGKAAAGDFFPNLNKFYFSFGVGCFFFFFTGKCPPERKMFTSETRARTCRVGRGGSSFDSLALTWVDVHIGLLLKKISQFERFPVSQVPPGGLDAVLKLRT